MTKDPIVMVINGYSGVGKDTFIEQLSLIHGVVYNHSSVEIIKHRLYRLGMRKIRKGPKEREFISVVKTAWIKYNNGALRDFLSHYNSVKTVCAHQIEGKTPIIVEHVREYKEIKKLQRIFKKNFISVRVVRDGFEPVVANDTEVDFWPYDYIIENNEDIESLKTSAILFLNDILGKE